ncbi:BTB/POZ domain protein [Ostertagia ostertagi]
MWGAFLTMRVPFKVDLLLFRLAKLRDSARLCDVTLVAEGTRISAHRVVLAASTDYFEAMFANDMAESRMEEIEIKDVEAAVLGALVNFCYSGKIRISSTNVWTVLPTACLLQLNEVKDVIGTDEFYRLPGNQLVELISSEELQVPSQEKVFEAVVDWVRFDIPARQQLLPQVVTVFLVVVRRPIALYFAVARACAASAL